MKILLLGKNGQVGWELQRALQPLGIVTALARHSHDSLSGDITNQNAMQTLFATVQPDIVVNAAAYTAVDKAETEQDMAEAVNHLAVARLANLCKQYDSLFINYSTDYVFSGTGTTPWHENDTAQPVNRYGQSKRAGEIAIEHSGCAFINLRTSWVYGIHGNNFIKTMLKLAKTKPSLSIVCDQIGAPTGAALIADVTAQIIRFYCLQNFELRLALHGHYHLAAKQYCSWYDYAQFVFETARDIGTTLAIEDVTPVPTIQYPTPAKRPLNSRLATQKLTDTFQLHLPEWQIGVRHVVQQLLYSFDQ